jgi:hypothetical protein
LIYLFFVDIFSRKQLFVQEFIRQPQLSCHLKSEKREIDYGHRQRILWIIDDKMAKYGLVLWITLWILLVEQVFASEKA